VESRTEEDRTNMTASMPPFGGAIVDPSPNAEEARRSPTLTRRSAMAQVALGATAVAVAAPARAVANGRKPARGSIRSTKADVVVDEVVELAAAWPAADQRLYGELNGGLSEAEMSLPKWARGEPLVDATMPGEPTWRDKLQLGDEISFAELRTFNQSAEDACLEPLRQAHAALLAAGQSAAATEITRMITNMNSEERACLRAEGRERVRWWIAQRRKQDACREAAGIFELEAAIAEAEPAFRELGDKILSTRALSLEGVVAKLRLGVEWIRNGNPDGKLEWGHEVIVTALADAERLLREAAASVAA
jgi:hypothetical protein